MSVNRNIKVGGADKFTPKGKKSNVLSPFVPKTATKKRKTKY